MEKVTLKLTRDELQLMSDLVFQMVESFQYWIGDMPRFWETKLKEAVLIKLNVKLAGKLAFSKRQQKVSFSAIEITAFIGSLNDFNWNIEDSYHLAFRTRLAQEIEPKFI